MELCEIAVSRPSRVAPSFTRWMVAGRWVVLSSEGRGSAIFTGLCAALAARAASTTSARINSFLRNRHR
jgi:hypothetical protein